MECPEDEILLALVEGRLRGEALGSVDAHLDGCALCREAVGLLGSGPRPRQTRLERGDRVGRFEILAPIGEGAMGIVYAAFDPELDRKVALKVLRGDRSDARARARLVREAQAMARLSHPHVVGVYEVGAEGDDVHVAMELVEGTHLREWLRAERSPETILALFRDAGAGLAAAHAAGLVHRDFKPENVLVTADGTAKVGDFGLAVGEGEPPGEVPEGALLDATLTATGALLGTPAYMAPEQLDGDEADARADQFAFCVALHEALVGARPFEGRTLGELRAAIEEGPPKLRVAAPVASALRRGLSARREDRFARMEDLLEELRPRRGIAIAVVGAAGIVTALLVGLAVLRLPEPPPARSPCESSHYALGRAAWSGLPRPVAARLDAWAARWTTERVDACEATHIRHEQSAERMDRRMACLDRQRAALDAVAVHLRDTAPTPYAVDVIETLPAPEICAIDADLPPPAPEQAADVARRRRELDDARIRIATANPEGALTALQAVVSAAAELRYPPLIAEAGRLRASALRALARFDEAEQASEAALLVAEAFGDDRGTAEGWLERVRVAGERGRFQEAAERARHAEAAITRAGAPPDLANALLLLRGVLRTSLGELPEAEEDLRAALRAAEARFGEDALETASIHASLGDLLRVESRLDEALAEHERALAIDRSALGDEHPRVGRDLHNVAGILRRLDRSEEAQARYEEALRIKRAALGDEHPEVALTRNSLGLMARGRGDLAEARRQWLAAVAIFEAHAHGDAALVRFNLALADADEARWASAEEQVRRAIALDTERIGPRAKRVGSEHVVLARALAGLRRTPEAREAAATARSIGEELGDAELVAAASAIAMGPAPAPAPAPARTPAPEPAAAPEPEPAPAPPTPPRPTGSGAYGASRSWE